MAAGAWTVYNKAKKKIGNGSISLASTAFRMQLHTSASNANTATLSTIASVDNQVTEANGYSSSGKALTSEVWTAGASAGQYKFDADDVFWSSGASAGARHILCRSQLSTSQFSLSTGNRLTIQMNASGILTLA
jgi:hypothetical protein